MSPEDIFETLPLYKNWAPTPFDTKGLHGDSNNIADFRVLLSQNQDSSVLERANFIAAIRELGGESEKIQVHRFGHWSCGWFEIILVHPDKATMAAEIISALDTYPILDENLFSDMEQIEADEVWEHYYSQKERIAYIRKYRSQFEFHDFRDLWGCVKGRYFAGYPGDLLRYILRKPAREEALIC